jgi:hypothetical protein
VAFMIIAAKSRYRPDNQESVIRKAIGPSDY